MQKKKNRLGAHYLLMEFIAYFVLTVETSQTALFTVYDHPVKSPPPLPPYTSSLILENVPSSLCELSSITTVDSTTTSQTADVNHKVLYLHCPKLITIDRAETSITSTSNSLVQLVIKAAHKSDRRLRTDQSDKPHQRSRTSAKLPSTLLRSHVNLLLLSASVPLDGQTQKPTMVSTVLVIHQATIVVKVKGPGRKFSIPCDLFMIKSIRKLKIFHSVQHQIDRLKQPEVSLARDLVFTLHSLLNEIFKDGCKGCRILNLGV